jgi:hypothetical protein
MSRSIEAIQRDISATEALRSQAGEQMDAGQDGLYAERLASLNLELDEVQQGRTQTTTDVDPVYLG